MPDSEPETLETWIARLGDPALRADAIRHLAGVLDAYGPYKSDRDARRMLEVLRGWASAGQSVDPALALSAWNLFFRLPASVLGRFEVFEEARATVLAIPDPSYGPKAAALLDAPAGSPDDLVWQGTAVEVIGRLRYAPAARVLVAALLTPEKDTLAGAASRALLRIPVDAEPLLVTAMKGTDADLARLASRFPDHTHLVVLADALALASRPAGRDAVLEALEGPLPATVRYRLATSLARFPPDAQTRRALLDAHATLPASAVLADPPGLPMRVALAANAHLSFDPTLVPWLVTESKAKGLHDFFRLIVLEPASLLMLKADKHRVGTAYAALAPGAPPPNAPVALPDPLHERGRRLFAAASEVLDRCGADVACHLGVLDETRRETPDWHAVKAVWMSAIHGGGARRAETRAALIARVDKLADADARRAAAQAIDFLTPEGDAAAAAQLEAIAATLDRTLREGLRAGTITIGGSELAAANAAVTEVAERLRARAAR